MIRIAVCDDEDGFLFLEKKIIKKYMDKHSYQYKIDTFLSGIEFLKLFNSVGTDTYDIVFLDVNMDKLDGVEVAKRIREAGKMSYIVFITAFIAYALEGYKVDATRYLLKDSLTLENSIEECLDTIVKKMNFRKNKKRFTFLEGERTIFLDEIVYVESNLHKLTFCLNSCGIQKYSMYEKLDTIDEQIHTFGFCRIHKSFLVNFRYVQDVKRYSVRLAENICDRSNLNISQARYDTVKEQFIFFQGEI